MVAKKDLIEIKNNKILGQDYIVDVFSSLLASKIGLSEEKARFVISERIKKHKDFYIDAVINDIDNGIFNKENVVTTEEFEKELSGKKVVKG